MENTFQMIRDYATHPLMLAILVAVLVLYQTVSKRSSALPRIPLGLVIVYLVLEIMSMAIAPYDIGRRQDYLKIATTVALYCVVARFAIMIIIDLWLKRVHKLVLPKITREFILAVAVIVIVLWVLRVVGGINLASLLTTSAILTAVIGLALQDTLGSFFAGLSLQIERPYQIGDWVVCKGHEGRVVGISWRTTRIQTRFNEIVYIPNNEISKDVIKNLSQPDETIEVKVEFGVEYDAAPNKVRRVALDVLARHPHVVKEFRSTVRLLEFADFSIKYAAFTKIDDLKDVYLIMADIRNQLWYALKRHGIRIPFPIRDVNVRTVDDHREREERQRWIEKGLACMPIFKALARDDIAVFADKVRVEHYGMGEEIVRQGDEGETMYLIQTGTGRVYMEMGGAEARVVATLSTGDFFGEMSLLTGERRTASVVAAEDLVALAIGRDAIRGLLDTHPDVAGILARSLADRQAALDQIKKEKTVVENTAKTFLERIKGIFGLS